jgi:hypothetical protein
VSFGPTDFTKRLTPRFNLNKAVGGHHNRPVSLEVSSESLYLPAPTRWLTLRIADSSEQYDQHGVIDQKARDVLCRRKDYETCAEQEEKHDQYNPTLPSAWWPPAPTVALRRELVFRLFRHFWGRPGCCIRKFETLIIDQSRIPLASVIPTQVSGVRFSLTNLVQ